MRRCNCESELPNRSIVVVSCEDLFFTASARSENGETWKSLIIVNRVRLCVWRGQLPVVLTLIILYVEETGPNLTHCYQEDRYSCN